MLDFLNGCRNDVFYQGFHQPSAEGRDAIKKLYELFVEEFLCEIICEGRDHKYVFRDECKSEESIAVKYNAFYERHGDELGQYYRT
jgi:hypothetical protein